MIHLPQNRFRSPSRKYSRLEEKHWNISLHTFRSDQEVDPQVEAVFDHYFRNGARTVVSIATKKEDGSVDVEFFYSERLVNTNTLYGGHHA